MDPFSLIAAGVGTVGSLASGIYGAATAGSRKKKWKEQQREEALHQLRRQQAAEMGYPVGGDGAHTAQKIDQQADEQFAIDPMSFVPFVQQGTKLASGIYGAANEAGPQNERLAPDPIARQTAQAVSAQDEAERAEALKHFQSQYGADYRGWSR